jgi:hypothetical protein
MGQKGADTLAKSITRILETARCGLSTRDIRARCAKVYTDEALEAELGKLSELEIVFLSNGLWYVYPERFRAPETKKCSE